jgi:hypothetical protein
MSQMLPTERLKLFDDVAAILIRCFIFNLIALLFVWSAVLLIGDTLYLIHSYLADLTRKEFDLFMLYSLTFIKLLNVVFFLIPFVAIKHLILSRYKNV